MKYLKYERHLLDIHDLGSCLNGHFAIGKSTQLRHEAWLACGTSGVRINSHKLQYIFGSLNQKDF